MDGELTQNLYPKNSSGINASKINKSDTKMIKC